MVAWKGGRFKDVERDWMGDGAAKLVVFGEQGKCQMSRAEEAEGDERGGRPPPSPLSSLSLEFLARSDWPSKSGGLPLSVATEL